MDDASRAEVERKGGIVTGVEELLGLDAVDMEGIEFRLLVVRMIRRRREALGLSQADLAARIGVSRPRKAKIDNGAGVSLDSLMGAYFATGATLGDLAGIKD